MSKVGVVVDTGSTIPAELVEEYGIEMIPVITVCDDKPYRDWIDLETPAELFKLIDKADKFPTTSASPPADYLAVFRRLSRKVDSILCVTISSDMSMCFKSANLAKEKVSAQFNCVELHVCEFNPTATLITGPRNLGLSFYNDGA